MSFFEKNIYEEALRLYAGQHVVDRVKSQKSDAFKRSVEEVELLLLAQDIKPFTSFSHKMTASVVSEFQGEYLDRMSECFESGGGVIVQIIGDSLVTYWKLSDADRVVAAVKRAKTIGVEISDKWRGYLPNEVVPMHGIDCGTVMRGNCGARTRLNYAIMGGVVNFTMRLCSANSQLKTQSLFSSRVRALVSNKDELKFRESIIVKGRASKEDLFTLEDVDPTPTQPVNTPT